MRCTYNICFLLLWAALLSKSKLPTSMYLRFVRWSGDRWDVNACIWIITLLQAQKTLKMMTFVFLNFSILTGLPLVCVSGVGPSLWVSSRCLRRVPHQVRSPAGTPGPWRTSYRWTPPAHLPLSCGSPPSPVCSIGRKKKQLSSKSGRRL